MKLFLLLFLSIPLFSQLLIDSGSATDQYFIGGANDFTISYPGASGDLSIRYGAFRYHIPQAPGVYLVTLNFRETGTVSAKGQRVFSVKLNGQLVLDRFDLFAERGLALTERNYVTASNDGFIDIDFSYTAKSAIISSIQVQLFQSAGSSLPTVTAWSSCHGSGVLAGPEGPGTPPGALWPGLAAVPPGWNCDGLKAYTFKLADGSSDGIYVAVKMPADFSLDPVIWVKQ